MSDLWDREKQSPHVLVKLDYVRLLQDLPSGVLLSQIAYWSRPSKAGKTKLSFYKEGVQWIVKTRDEWCEETGLTLNQYKRAHGMLVEHGFIESSVVKFQGRPVTALRLQEGALLSALKGMDSDQSNWLETSQSSVGGNQPINSVETSHSLYTENTEETTTETTGESQGQEPMKASDVLKNFQTLKTGVNANFGSMPLAWKKGMAHHTDGYVKELTLSEKGMLNHVSKALGKDEAVKVLSWCMENWTKFAYHAASEAGLSNSPAAPSVPFFTKHYAAAVQLIAQADKPKKAPPTKLPSTPTLPVVEALVPGDNGAHEEETASAEDILALMNKLSNQPPQDKE